ncbi:hypothetical protein PGQ11_012434 [Apiospora arundinis]|uniref:Uncharacterized protein n=1 Tax=Apiospora arundinis TaxID=335852 RepID=A0ABR2I2B4_9PEZI
MDREKTVVFPFLDLPIEVRLQVYKWVHLQHPLLNKQPKPHDSSAYVCKRVIATVNIGLSEEGPGPLMLEAADGGSINNSASNKNKESARAAAAPMPLLSPYRHCAAIPTALLRANRQIYTEARAIALEESEFNFTYLTANPGIYTAHVATLCLLPQPWQRNVMRYVRLEVTAWDLVNVSKVMWTRLCGLWAVSLRGLRIKIQSSDSPFNIWRPSIQAGQNSDGGDIHNTPIKGISYHARKTEEVPLHIMLAGLRLLKALQQLEIELNLLTWDAADKITWCRKLGEALNEDRGKDSRPVDVICVEKK